MLSFVKFKNRKMLKLLSLDIQAVKRAPQLLACLSTAVQPQERIQSFRCPHTDTSKHSYDNIGQFYNISPEERGQLFTHGGIPKSYSVQTKTFVETCLMIREPSLDVISCIKGIDFEKPTVRFVLYGAKGSGKSLTLAHVLHYGLQHGFLLLHVPWVGRWMRYCKEFSNSESRPGCVDVNLDAAAWLHHFKTQNAHLLSREDFVTHEDYTWSKRETTVRGRPLVELIDHGINRVKYASDCVVALCREIKKLSTEGKCKTMVAVDGYNAFFYPNTRVYTEKKEMVPPARVTLTEGFLEVTRNDWKNGVCVLTVDEIAIAEEDQISHLPRYLLGKSGFEFLDPFVPIKVGNYTEKELLSCMDYYRERRWVQPVHGQDEELAFLSAYNPYTLMKLCGPL